MNFRKDINGLRAIAVIAVVLFHFNSSWLSGGFAGVDVFFVISGFLMTGIIFKGIEQENFSLMRFYVARANRIIPALALLSFLLLVFGWFFLTPLDYKSLGKHVASSVGFLSNIFYWRESGYFDAASHEKWLLHTWSLSVEWQFYIVYPLLLLVLKRIFSLTTLKSLIIVGTVIGFIFSVYATYKWPSASYYLFPMRAWEMMLGGVAFLYPLKLQQNSKRLVEVSGLALIISSYIFITGDNPWPGYLALSPVLGTFLVIQAQRNESMITGNIVFQKLGAWSYSIYLWHWPFVVAIYTFSLPNQYIYIGMALSVLLGYLSYKYIEMIRFPRSFPTVLGYLKCKPLYITGIVGLLSSVLFIKFDALTPIRLSNQQSLIVEQQVRNPRELECGNVINGVSPGCLYGKGPVKAIVVGDSHAQAQVVALGYLASRFNGSILDLGLSGCTTIKGLYRYNKKKYGDSENHNCGNLVTNSIELAATKYPGIPVIIINRLTATLYGGNESQLSKPFRFVGKIRYSSFNDEYIRSLQNPIVDTMCKFSKTNPVYVTRPTPELIKDVPKTMFRKGKAVRIQRKMYDSRHKLSVQLQNQASKTCGIKILDPIPYLCDENYCYGDKNNIPLYFDDDHLSQYGAQLISPIYEEVFK